MDQVPTRDPVLTGAIGRTATARPAMARTGTVRRRVNLANGAVHGARVTGAGRLRIGTVRALTVGQSAVALMRIAAVGPARVAVPTGVVLVRIGTGPAAVVPTGVVLVRIGTGRAAGVPTGVVLVRIGTGSAVVVRTAVVLVRIVIGRAVEVPTAVVLVRIVIGPAVVVPTVAVRPRIGTGPAAVVPTAADLMPIVAAGPAPAARVLPAVGRPPTGIPRRRGPRQPIAGLARPRQPFRR